MSGNSMSLMKRPCPICKGPAEQSGPIAPFCSEKCKLTDLGEWAAGKRTIKGKDGEALSQIESQNGGQEHLDEPRKKP